MAAVVAITLPSKYGINIIGFTDLT